jgi:hypothetical protein
LSSMSRFATWMTVLSLPLVACMQIGTDTGTGSTTGADGGAVSSADGATASTAASGCGTDPATGLILCLAVAVCPNLAVDPTAFPSCGFRQGGASELDLECLCNGNELCPIGAPSSCSSVVQLLDQEQNALTVCQQVSTGTCVPVGDAGTASGSS